MPDTNKPKVLVWLTSGGEQDPAAYTAPDRIIGVQAQPAEEVA